MRRGFKAEAERLAASARESLGLGPRDKLDPWAYARSLGITVLDFNSLDLPPKDVAQLVEKDGESWSGLTLKEGGNFFVVLNPSQSAARQCSTLMHEVAHIRLGHRPAGVSLSGSGMMLLSDYPDDLEQEADWLAAALLLPRDALHHFRRSGWDRAAICDQFGVSTQLYDWRLRKTGVELQLRRRFG